MDDPQLIVQALANLWVIFMGSIAPFEAVFTQLLQICLGGEFGGDFEIGQVVTFKSEVNVAAIGDQHSV